MPPLEVTARVLVKADAERVWQLAMNWSRQRQWMWGTQVSGGASVGAEVVARTGIGRLGFEDTMVITEWDPPRRCVVRHTGKVVRGHGIFEVVPHGPVSEFRWTEQLDLPLSSAGPLGRWVVDPAGRWAVAPLARLGLAGSLRRFARLV
ncbi:MAG TPA: SRPBCC family protein [Streptosporangiaceae bacterium]|nr:SRPBCC family protein [Streptosporangiaceae bacterium]